MTWLQNKLHYNNTPLNDVIKDLERIYNCKIKIAPEQNINCLLSGNHDNKSLHSVLQSIDIEWGDVYQTFRRFGYYNIKAKDLKKTGKNGIDQIEFQLAPSNYVVMFNQDELGGLLTGSLSVINNLFGK